MRAGRCSWSAPSPTPQEEGSTAIFTSRAAAEEFVEGDPFALNRVVRGWQIREWNEVLVT